MFMKTCCITSIYLAAAPLAYADVLEVPGDFSTIQAAIDAANHGDEVLVMPGSYFEAIDLGAKEITVRGSAGPDATVIDATGLFASVVTCTSGETPQTVIEGFGFTGGAGTLQPPWPQRFGGGMYCVGSSPTVRNCVFFEFTYVPEAGVSGLQGASIYATDGSRLIIENCSFIDNGGFFDHEVGVAGIHLEQGSDAVITGCLFQNNDTGAQGPAAAIMASLSSPAIVDCTFRRCSAFNGAGAVRLGLFSNGVVRGCLFEGNDGDDSGALHTGAAPLIEDCRFIGNRSTYVGGAIVSGGNPTITGCVFHGNETGSIALGRGAAIYSRWGNLVIRDTLFEANLSRTPVAEPGAAIFLQDGEAIITGTTFRHNETLYGDGGAVYAWEARVNASDTHFEGNFAFHGGAVSGQDAVLQFKNCNFAGNTASSIGSAIAVSASEVTAIGCSFLDNVLSFPLGGTISTSAGSFLDLERCIFRGNVGTDGGGVRTLDSEAWLSNCLFEGNTGLRGGALHVRDSDLTAYNLTFVENRSVGSLGSALFATGASNVDVANSIFWRNDPPILVAESPASLDVRYSLVEPGGWAGEGNIAGDPRFVDPGAADWRLHSGSPAIDAGHNWHLEADVHDLDDDGDVEELTPLDLDGNPRFADDPGTADTGCGSAVLVDMGAYEFQGLPVQPMKLGDIDGSGSVGLFDLLILLDSFDSCTTGCCPADLNLDGIVSFVDLLMLLDRWG